MAHRDEFLALQARLEAAERELDEAKSEHELLRAAHAQKTREVEQLRRELAALREGRDKQGGDVAAERAFGLAAAAIGATALMVAMGVVASAREAMPPVAAPPADPVPAAIAGVHFGRVVSGGTPELMAEGETCSVEVTPVRAGPFDCRVEVRCGDRTIYGATADTGFVRCGGRAIVRDVHFSARDGDPAMELDLTARRVVVEEQLGLGTQRVEIELSPLFD